MFILDTNVVSELRKARSGRADSNVVSWAEGVPPPSLFLSVVTVLELELGVLLAERRDPAAGAALRSWLDGQVLLTFAGRVLAVDEAIAVRCARLHVPDRRSERDALIAATGLVHGMVVVTRNTADFEATGAKLLNPWEAADRNMGRA